VRAGAYIRHVPAHMLRCAFLGLLSVLGWCVLLSVLWVLVLRFLPPPVTWAMAQQVHEQGSVQRSWKPWAALSPDLPLAVIASEDQLFYQHHGFDVQAMRKALDHNARGRTVRGGSTISQQVAKNVFLWPGRNYLRKGLEAWFTLLIEAFWPKERILEMYLNVAETGKGRFGAEAVAQACFRKPAAKITREQAALVAAVLPAPQRFNACKPSAYVRRRQAWVLRQMRQLGSLETLAEPTSDATAKKK
jgi:monofunctional biosynthetic peptidoglycan transglycosylase